MDQKLQTTTRSEFLEIYSPKNLQEQFRNVATVDAAIAVKSKTMMELVKEWPREKVAALIKLQLIELNDLLDLRRPLTERAIDMIAEEVITTYKQLTVADVHVIFRRARTGYYEEFYESLNMPKVMKWFSSYFDERCEAHERLSIKEHQSHQSRGFSLSNRGESELAAHKIAHTAYQLQRFKEELANSGPSNKTSKK